ncbi:GntR family transcriptional regulator [uncultured Devosia sp.]|uniref:GntR family transcriptional regulator n=1 Tax=uncultured Devosia sp. TaxID=211434 RepID=UPI0035CBD3B7
MKTDTVYKLAFNQMLDLVVAAGRGSPLASENELSRQLGVSRTTVRKVLAELGERGVVALHKRGERVVELVPRDGRFPVDQTVPNSTQVEKRFLEWMLRGDAKPGSMINELDLARQFSVGTTGIREFLNRFSRFGLIEKRPNAGWLFKGFNDTFALELFEIRELFEMRSALGFARIDPRAKLWTSLAALRQEHLDLLTTFDDRFHDFSDLDNRFHRLINTAVPNRFIDDFYDIITFIFHYHYQWNKRDERQRNRVAIQEHLDYIDALFSRDESQVQAACARHLQSARITLLAAVSAN